MGEFIFNMPVTRELIESVATPEQLMHMYTGIIPKANKLYKSPFRNEERPSCSFYIGKSNDLLLRDFGEGKSYAWYNIIMKKFSCSYFRAIEIAAEDLGLRKKSGDRKTITKLLSIPKIENSYTNLQVQIKNFSESELEWWGKYGITKDILNYFNTFSVETVFINGNIHTFSSNNNPIYSYYLGKQDSIEIHKIYIPKAKNKAYRFLTNGKEHIIQGWDQMKKSSSNVLVITKSQKDNMCLYGLGITAISPNSENIFISDNIFGYLKSRFKYIFLLYDNDLTGIKFTNKIRKKYPVIPLLIPRKYGCKDISDFRKVFGRDKTKELINSVILKWNLNIEV